MNNLEQIARELAASLLNISSNIYAPPQIYSDEFNRRYMDTIRKALRSVAPPNGWQPIETAPNGEWVMVWSCKYDTVHTARNNGGWEICNPHMDDDSGIWDCFTHWMPLPAAPKPPEDK